MTVGRFHRKAQLDSRTLLIIALMGALLFHGALSIFGTYRNTYDAYVHIFFADHWRRGWFDHWEPRWYTGYHMTSYPPLSQQSVALVSLLTGDLRLAFALVQTGAMLTMTLGMYRFAKLWVSDEAAGWAAIWLVFSTAMAETIHVFGQLPTTFSLGMLLNALPFVYAWIVRGKPGDLVKGLALTAATTGAHHVTTLFGSVFIIAPVVVLALVERLNTEVTNEPGYQQRFLTKSNLWPLVFRRLRRVLGPGARTAVYGVGAVILLLVVVFPYWAWSRSDPITQVAIPHSSRDNFLVNLNAGLVFWLIPYGLMLFVFPYAYYKGLTSKAWPLLASISLLALLGTGGTTPIPKLLLGGAFDVLTLDRFTLWASILMLPLAGEFVVSLRTGGLGTWISENFGRYSWYGAMALLAVGLAVAAIMTVSLTQFRKFQPAPIETTPITNFLEKDEHARWRYLTLGFGDQMAWLSAQTTAQQVDGNYHSARRLPELTTTPVERLEGAKFRGIPGIGSLQQFLAVPDKYQLKYIFSNDQFYDPLLFFYGWHRVQVLENGIAVWERADIPVLPEVTPRREIPLYQRLMFGILPPLALVAAVVTTTYAFWSIPFRVLAELLGFRRRSHFSFNLIDITFGHFWRWLDGWMLNKSQLTGNGRERAPRWQLMIRLAVRKMKARLRPHNLRAWHIRLTVLAFGMTALLLIGYIWVRNQQDDPKRIVEAYYDHVDFRRTGDAYKLLNPATRPAYDQYILDLSLSGGIVASYGKLDSIKTTLKPRTADIIDVETEVIYVTALSYYNDKEQLQLTRTPDGWRLEPQKNDATVPPGQFLRSAHVDYMQLSRRLDPSGPRDFAEAPDRPNITVLSSRLLVTADGRFSVVGEVYNNDVNPGDLTVRATIFDSAGAELTTYNAADGTIHKMLPFEVVPFRVDFEGVAGLALEEAATSMSFEPGETFAYRLPPGAELGGYDVYGKAVITQYDLLREVSIQDLRATMAGGQLFLSGQLINTGLIEAVVPHLLVTLYNEDGEVAWVDHTYLRESVRPQRTQDFLFPVTSAGLYREVDLPGQSFTNDRAQLANLPAIRSDFLPLPPESGYSYARVSVNYFTGNQ